MGKFDGILICTDLDGTLLRKDKSISEENLAAIDYFCDNGGAFTIVANCVTPLEKLRNKQKIKP